MPDPGNGMHDIPDNTENLYYIKGLVYYRLDMRVDTNTDGSMRLIHYISDFRDRPDDDDVRAFLNREIIGHERDFDSPDRPAARNVGMPALKFRVPGEPTPYDLRITRGCKIVIQMASRWNWRFQRGHKGVTTKIDQTDRNRNLIHLEEDGATIVGLPSTAHPCRFVYFTVAKRRAGEVDHHINIHVEFDTRQIDILDPDIKNDGSIIPPP